MCASLPEEEHSRKKGGNADYSRLLVVGNNDGGDPIPCIVRLFLDNVRLAFALRDGLLCRETVEGSV
jgi:hypothetical protein